MSGKFIARASALSLAFVLAACGGDDSSTPLVSGGGNTGGSTGGSTGGGTDAPQEVNLSLGAGFGSAFVEGQVESDIGSNTLSAGGQTNIRVYIVDKNNGNSPVTGSDISVQFSSNCISSGDAQVASPISAPNGLAETTYFAEGCTPQDLVTARVGNSTASTVINIAPPSADRIESIPLETTSIAPTGAGSTSRPSQAPVSFKVVDSNGIGVKGIDVTFSLTGDDFSAEVPVRLSTSSGTSTTGGEVTTLVIAGSASTTVRVIATIERESGPESTQSEPIAINSLIPTEEGFTLASENFLPDAQFTAGVLVRISSFATDRNGQNIRGNTIVNFTTDGGSITPECQLSEEGVCSVFWRSQAPWLTEPTITATTIGETASGTVETISQSLRLFISSSRNPMISLSEGSEAQQYCASATVASQDFSRIHPADGTTIDFAISDGEILSSKTSYEVNGESGVPDDTTQFTACIFAKKTNDGVAATITATVTTPGNEVADAIYVIPAG